MRLKVCSLKKDEWFDDARIEERDGKAVLKAAGQPLSPEAAEQRDLEVVDATAQELTRLREAGYRLRGMWTEDEVKEAYRSMRSFVRWRKGSEFEIEDFANQLHMHRSLASLAAEHLEANGELTSTNGRYRLQTFGMD